MNDLLIQELARLKAPSRDADFTIFAHLSMHGFCRSGYSGSDIDDDHGEFGAVDSDGHWHPVPAYTSDMDLAMSLFITRPANAMPNAWTACQAAMYQRRNATAGPAYTQDQMDALRWPRGQATMAVDDSDERYLEATRAVVRGLAP